MIEQKFMTEYLLKIEPLIENKKGFHNLVIPYDPEWSWPFAWYDQRNKRIYIKYSTDWSASDTINHEIMHKLLDLFIGNIACSRYDKISDFVESWTRKINSENSNDSQRN